MTEIRTRFAPSPTGFMHVGGVRTALFGWLLTQTQPKSSFILRIEDTDQKRTEAGSVEHIMESLRWLGITWQEGPDIGGAYGPYTQSERLGRYQEVALQLLSSGHAYVDASSAEQMNGWRSQAQAEKRPFLFRNHRDEAIDHGDWDTAKPLRFKIDDPKRTHWHDEVRGDLTAGEDALDDFIIMKADGYPTYNFAHIVDDFDMKITHVLRGEEFIASMPKFLALYEALGYELPLFVTVPPILNSNGGKKLSKRDGAKDVLQYREEGFLPEAVINFLATMGWNDGTEKEIFTTDELTAAFSLKKIQRSGAKFDDERLTWISGHHIRQLSTKDLFDRIDNSWWPDAATNSSDTYKQQVLSLVQERLKNFAELSDLTHFFFQEPALSKEILTQKKLNPDESARYLDQVISQLKASDFSEADIESRLRTLVEVLGTKPGVMFSLVRVCVTGSTIAPGLFETLHALGAETSLKRLAQARQIIAS